jgi:hypothetical protein
MTEVRSPLNLRVLGSPQVDAVRSQILSIERKDDGIDRRDSGTIEIADEVAEGTRGRHSGRGPKARTSEGCDVLARRNARAA